MRLRWLMRQVGIRAEDEITPMPTNEVLDYKIMFDDGKMPFYYTIHNIKVDNENKAIILST